MKFPRRKIEMNVASLALFSAAFIVLAYNRLFWSSLFDVIDIGNVKGMLLAGDVFIIVTVAATLFFICFGIKHIFKPVLMLIFVLSSLISYFEGHYGVVIDKTMIQNILETDYRETAETAPGSAPAMRPCSST
jgi:lipid A ethanolaminephosphotransferase